MKTKLLRKVQFIAVWIATLLFVVPSAFAHRPVEAAVESEAIQVPDLSTSYAFYRDLTSAQQVDVYTFQGNAGEFFNAGISIPVVPGLEDYSVSMALVGPGLSPSTNSDLPLEISEEAGSLIIPSSDNGEFFEPFTQTNYWTRQKVELELPKSGDYRLLIWNENGRTGKYVLDTGREEVFGPGDLFLFPIWWVQVHTYFEHTPYLVAAAFGIVIIIAAFGFLRYKSRYQLKTASYGG